MIDDARLQKVMLGPDWIDLSFGEPKVVMNALFRQINRYGDPFKMPTLYDLPKWGYQLASGKPDLVSILEDKYNAKVVVCNGAKQALHAGLYALQKHGLETIHFPIPFYPANTGLVESVGLVRAELDRAQGFLITSPNNPDGKITPVSDIIVARQRGPTIHDAAYYTEVYLPEGEIPLPLGHIQIYSMSKMYGLSGLRIGYAVVHDETYYQDIVNYMEMTTAGVSTASQDIARNIEAFFRDNPSYYKDFVKEARASITLAREELKGLNPEVLELIPTQCNSMFGWFKKGPKLDNKTAKVHMLDGVLFGQPGMMRMNIAYPPEVIRDAVERLNKHKIRS